MAKAEKFQQEMIAHLERRTAEDGPASMAAIMLANAKAKIANPDHRWDPAILQAKR